MHNWLPKFAFRECDEWRQYLAYASGVLAPIPDQSSNMRVAVIGSRGFPSTYSGFETLVRWLAPALARRGHEVTVYGRGGTNKHRPVAANDVTTINTVGLETKSTSTLSYGLTSTIDALVRRSDVALVLNVANGYYVPVLERAGIPTVANVDGVEWARAKWNTLGRHVFRAGARSTARFASAIVADSKAIQRFWAEEFGRSSTFIPYGAEVTRDRSTRRIEQLGLRPDGYLLVVARLVPENNIDLSLDAVERLPGEHLVVVGTSGYRSPVEDRLRALSQTGRAKWLGHVSDQDLLLDLWANCAGYIHGHSVGGTNPSLLQAMGAGAPTIALDTPYNREVLAREDALYQRDAGDLSRRLSELLASPDARAYHRFACQARIRDEYTWPHVCLAYERLLRAMPVRAL